jgi:hypothetical protein
MLTVLGADDLVDQALKVIIEVSFYFILFGYINYNLVGVQGRTAYESVPFWERENN